MQTDGQIVQTYAQSPRKIMGENRGFFPLDSMMDVQRYARTYRVSGIWSARLQRCAWRGPRGKQNARRYDVDYG
ncbi:hypothetical protein NBRC116597_37290 [Phaeobacter sp. NW0010-22]